MTDTNARQQLYEEQQNLIDQDMSPFGFVDDGIPDYEKPEIDEYGTVLARWSHVKETRNLKALL